MIQVLRLLSLVVAVSAVAGCSGSLDPTGGKRLGVISFYSDPIVVQAPDTVQAGTGFAVKVRTYGNGCISEDGTEVRVEASVVEVRPFDIHSGAALCPDILNMFDHRATVTLAESGSFEIRFIGMAMPGDSTVTIVSSVVVE